MYAKARSLQVGGSISSRPPLMSSLLQFSLIHHNGTIVSFLLYRSFSMSIAIFALQLLHASGDLLLTVPSCLHYSRHLLILLIFDAAIRCLKEITVRSMNFCRSQIVLVITAFVVLLFYTVSHEKSATRYLLITLKNVDRF